MAFSYEIYVSFCYFSDVKIKMDDDLDQPLIEIFLDSDSEGEFEGFTPQDLPEIVGDADACW